MPLLANFLSPKHPSLKICGITQSADAEKLAELGVPALGVNFWPQSKRFCSPEQASQFLPQLKGKIVRVGVFVNNATEHAPALMAEDCLDIIQLHGDETEEELLSFLTQGFHVIRSLALKQQQDLAQISEHYQSLTQPFDNRLTLLLDAHAPGVYGGTGETIDWQQANEFIQLAQPLPVLLAGGLTPANASQALEITKPAGLDIASGAEIEPGCKDFEKVESLLRTTRASPLS